MVGANGSGKTSIFRKILIKELAPEPQKRNCIFIYENDLSTYILNETQFNFVETEDFKLIDYHERRKILNEKVLYYSPNLDYDLQDINSSISLVNYHQNDLSSFYLDNLKRHLFFLSNLKLISTLKDNFKDFPYYDKLEFKAKALYKSDFEKIYIQTTLGNKLFRIRNRLLDMAESNKKNGGTNGVTLDENQIEDIFDNNETIQDQLKAIWDVYKNENNQKSQYLHDNSNFLANVEVNLLSYLVIQDTFSLDGDYGSYPFSKILEAIPFEEKLTHFLRKYIIQTSELFYRIIGADIDITTNNIERIKDKVIELSDSQQKFLQVSYENKAKGVLNKIELIEYVFKFYTSLLALKEDTKATNNSHGFSIKVRDLGPRKFEEFINLYKNLLLKINHDNLNDVLEIKSSKKLSTGEKSILDMYASIYDYLRRWGNKDHMYCENYILILDEPELGYHPLWKKKFIKSITSTLTNLFKVNKIARNIQIIFSTHDPLTLSDIPQRNVVYLDKNVKDVSLLINEQLLSFGANVHDLLAHSFFLEDGFMGEFAKDIITDLIDYLTYEEDKDKLGDNRKPKREWNSEKAQTVINIIDEPLIKERVQSLLNKKFLYHDKELLRSKIQQLRVQLEKLEDEEN